MSLLPDPDSLKATANGISRHAEELRKRATGLVKAADDAHWFSPSARQHRADAEAMAKRMRTAADRIDDAADALRDHARVIELEIALVKIPLAAAEWGVEAAGDVAQWGAETTGDVADAVVDGIGDGASAVAGAGKRVLSAVGIDL